MNPINWYPGHMAKTKRQLSDQLKMVDLVIELCDARLPYSSRNPDLNRMLEGKKRLLMMNKADLADSEMNLRWLRYFQMQGEDVRLCSALQVRKGDAIAAIANAVKEKTEKAAAKGIRKTVRVMVAGVPNVGKSTYINRLHGGSIATTGDRPGVTRSSQWIKIDPYLELLDTPGLLWPRLDDQTAARRLCYIGSVKDEILDLQALAMHLLEDMVVAKPESVMDRFHLKDPSLRGLALMEEVCRGRGFLLKGGSYDYDRCASIVLDEFRSGKLGQISLETPPLAELEGQDDKP